MKPIKHIKTGESGDGIKFVQSGESKLDLKNIGKLVDKKISQITKEDFENWNKMDKVKNHIEEIKEQGYTVLENQLTQEQIDFFLNDLKKIYEETKDKICQDVPYLNRTSPNIYNLQNKSNWRQYLDILLGNQQIEEILKYFLNDKFYKKIDQNQPNYILRHYGARSNTSALPLHIDSFIPYIGDEVIAMQVAIMLEDSTVETGCTTVIPGSHKLGKYADQKDIDKAIPLEAKKGSILLWDSRLIHGTTDNKSGGTRWAIISTFTRWFIKQMFDIPADLHYDTWKQLTKKERAILGFASRPWKNEYEGIEMKKGYEQL